MDVELARLAAKNSSTGHKLLKQLASSQDFFTRQGVATNPNATSKTLWKLATEFPQECINNPVLSSLIREDRRILLKQSTKVLLSVLENEHSADCIFNIIKQAGGYSYILKDIAEHPRISEKALLRLIKTGNPDLYLHLLQKPNLTSSFIKEIAETEIILGWNRTTEVISSIYLSLIKHKNTPLEILEKLASKANYDIKINAIEKIAKNKNISSYMIATLAFYPDIKIKKAIALRPDLDLDLIKKMALDRQIASKKILCKNKSLCEAKLKVLAKSSDIKVLQMVALHPNTPINLLKELASIPSVDCFVAQNPNLTSDIFEQLVQVNNQNINWALARNSKTPSTILNQLTLNNSYNPILIPISKNCNTPENTKIKILKQLSGCSDFSVLKYVAKNPYTPQDILITWSYSEKHINLYPLIAKNPNTPVNILERFYREHYSERLAKKLAINPNTPENILIKLSPEYFSFYDISYDQLLLNNPNLPLVALENILRRKSISRYFCDRKFVARHSKTPTEILEKLTKDKDMGVRDAAKYQLEQRNL